MPVIFLLLALIGPASAAEALSFRTPSGNIECVVGLGSGLTDISCTIFERRGPPPAPRPQGCSADWGHSFTMLSRGRAAPVCGLSEPGQSEPATVVEYGETVEFEGIACSSRRSGLECRNRDDRGFFLSGREQTVF